MRLPTQVKSVQESDSISNTNPEMPLFDLKQKFLKK
jgi:hypothetical protein